MVVDDDALARGVADGTLALDMRLRDALRALRSNASSDRRRFALPSERGIPLSFPPLTVADDAAYAVEAAVLSEADVVRIERRMDAFEQRLRSLELRPLSRLSRTTADPRGP
jgi:hypothetical protein